MSSPRDDKATAGIMSKPKTAWRVAPMPIASVATKMIVNVGDARRLRTAWRTSCASDRDTERRPFRFCGRI